MQLSGAYRRDPPYAGPIRERFCSKPIVDQKRTAEKIKMNILSETEEAPVRNRVVAGHLAGSLAPEPAQRDYASTIER